MINSLGMGGAERAALTLADEFRNRGLEIVLISMERNQFYELPSDIPLIFLSRHQKIKNPVIKFCYILLCALRLRRVVKEYQIDWVQSHLIWANFVNVTSSLLGSKHQTQIVSHMMPSFDFKRSLLGRVNLFLYRRLYSRADSVISTSQLMKLDLDRLFDLQNNHLAIPNAHDLPGIQEKALEEPSTFDFDPQKLYMISAGRLVARKKVDHSISALAHLKNKYPQLELLVLGDGPMRESYKRHAQKMAVQNSVHFLGHIHNPFSYLSRADVFVLSSEDEGLPLILIESLICGTPIVSSDCKSGPREILAPDTDVRNLLADEAEIEETDFGLLYPVGNVPALVMAIDRILSDSQLGEYLSEQGEIRGKSYHSQEIASRYLATMGLTSAKVI